MLRRVRSVRCKASQSQSTPSGCAAAFRSSRTFLRAEEARAVARPPNGSAAKRVAEAKERKQQPRWRSSVGQKEQIR